MPEPIQFDNQANEAAVHILSILKPFSAAQRKLVMDVVNEKVERLPQDRVPTASIESRLELALLMEDFEAACSLFPEIGKYPQVFRHACEVRIEGAFSTRVHIPAYQPPVAEDYRADVERFLSERCAMDKDATVGCGLLYGAFVAWRGDISDSAQAFGRAVGALGFEVRPSRVGGVFTRLWSGIALRSEAEAAA